MMRKPDLIFLSLTEAAKQLFGYEQVAKRIANIRLNEFRSFLHPAWNSENHGYDDVSTGIISK